MTRNRPFVLTSVLGVALAMVATVAVAAGPALASKPAPRPARAPLAEEVPGQPWVLALNFRGTARQERMAPDRFVSTTDLYSLATGERVGTATHDFAFTARPFVADHIMTFRLPEGQVVTHDLISFPSDPQHPGFFLIGIHPEGNTILPGRGTGAYAGRSGRLRMSGYHDATRLAGERLVTYDDFYLIELDPK